jgi:hypothetical protein
MEFRSKREWLGVPLVHVATGGISGGIYRRDIAKGWFAFGDISFGIVLSCGGIAVGGISLGGISLGLLAVGGVALGGAAFGGLAAGAIAAGGAAFAWFVALGGLAVAHGYAAGGLAIGGEVIGPGGGSDALRVVQYAVSVLGAVVRVGAVVLLLVLVARALRSSERVNRRGPR